MNEATVKPSYRFLKKVKTMGSAIYPGSFDPPTLGHINIVERALKIFEEVTIAVAINTSKTPFLSTEERVAALSEIFKDEPRVRVEGFEGLLVNYAKSNNCPLVLRGVRTVADFEYELQMSFANKKLWDQLDTFFIMTESHFSHISSTIIKEIAKFGGSLHDMVHPYIENLVKQKLASK